MAEDEINQFKVVVIGGSAGSLEVILALLQRLSRCMGAVIIIIVHRKNDKDSNLESLFSYKTDLSVREVEDKEPILPNHIYIAPADYHLLIENEQSFSLDSSEKIQFSRPSIDVTFESVAEIFGSRVVGILLSGANADGARGLLRIKECGGHTIAQDPEDADMGYMPQQAINLGAVDKVLNVRDLMQTVETFFD